MFTVNNRDATTIRSGIFTFNSEHASHLCISTVELEQVIVSWNSNQNSGL